MFSPQQQEESLTQCKICKRDGKTSRFVDHGALIAHLQIEHKISFNKPTKEKVPMNSSAPSSQKPNNNGSSYPKQSNNGRNFTPKPDLYVGLLHKKVKLHLADKVLTGTIEQVSMYDLLFSADSEDGRNSDVLVPKHSVLYVEKE